MIIRHANASDSNELFLWRNDETTRLMSKSSNVIDEKNHEKWLKQCISSKNCYLYIGILNNYKVGVVKFDCDFKKKESLVSINLNPQIRGKGLSFNLLSESIKKLQKLHQFSLSATIKKNNLISKKIFKKCGFDISTSNETYDFYLLYVK